MKAEFVQEEGNPTGHGNPDEWEKYIVDQNWEKFTDENHETWHLLFDRQSEIVKGRACDAYFAGLKELGIDNSGVPKFSDVNAALKAKTGFEVVPVAGLIPDLPFFKMLSMRKFPAGNFIRAKDSLDYIQEPDIFHDVFGHVPLLSDPVFADYVEAFGRGGLRAHEFGTITNLARLYWYTVEFGLMETAEGLRIYGAGILSSPGETVFSLEDDSPNRVRFDLKRVMQSTYRVDDYQQIYFAIESFEKLFALAKQDFAPIYEEIKAEDTTYGLTEIAPGDDVITEGTQDYANSKAPPDEVF